MKGCRLLLLLGHRCEPLVSTAFPEDGKEVSSGARYHHQSRNSKAVQLCTGFPASPPPSPTQVTDSAHLDGERGLDLGRNLDLSPYSQTPPGSRPYLTGMAVWRVPGAGRCGGGVGMR